MPECRNQNDPRLDFPQHVLDIGGGELVPRRLGDGAQLGVDRSLLMASSLPQCLADPFRNGHAPPPGNGLNRSILFVVQEDL